MLSVILVTASCVPALAEGNVFKGTWNGGAEASFSLKADSIITYCFQDDPCSDYRYTGSAEKFSISFPAAPDYAGGYMEFTRKNNSFYIAESYYGPEASIKIGTKYVAEFELN
jgi:hypothetical protein